MNLEAIFEAEKNLTLIARKAVLQEGVQARPIRKLVCPHCESKEVRRRMQSHNGAEYICRGCKQNVSEEDLPRCCPYPGKYIKCQGCSHFQAFTRAVKQKVQELRHLSSEERAAIVNDPNFYKFKQTEKLGQGSVLKETEVPLLPNDWSEGLQLSLLDDIDKTQSEDKEIRES